jgi:hypothetical protein
MNPHLTSPTGVGEGYGEAAAVSASPGDTAPSVALSPAKTGRGEVRGGR